MFLFTLLLKTTQRRSVVFAAFLVLCISGGSHSVEVRAAENASRDLLYKQLHEPGSGSFHLTKRKGRIELEVCEDQCGYFEAPTTLPMEIFWDFVFLFEYWASEESDLKAFRVRTEGHERTLLKKYQKECSDSKDPKELEMCIWKSLAKRYQIRLGVAVYDEGERCQSYWNPSDPIGKLSEPDCKPYQ